jgi:hypothetical protein
MTTVYLYPSKSQTKKWTAEIHYKNGSVKTVHFGAKGYSDYTIHKDPERKQRYIIRHKTRENWGKSGLNTAGFWSRWLLWGEPTITKSITAIKNKFGIKIVLKKF